MQAREDIPSQLLPPAEAAVAWINDTRGTDFQLTGVVDTEVALAAVPGDAFEIGIVLCDGDICAREQVRVTAQGDRFEICTVDVEDQGIPPLLDPPVGVRRSWLDDQIAKHDFILMLFYRGRW